MRHANAEELRAALRSTDELAATGLAGRRLARAVAEGTLVRVHRGCYLEASVWRDLWPESRHLARVIAVSEATRGSDPVFCLVSAACLWGLPLYRLEPQRVHLFAPAVDRHSTAEILRHEGLVTAPDVSERHGIRCTSLARTVHDLTRLLSPEAALAAADAALAQTGGDPRRFDADAAGSLRDELYHRASAPGVRGIRQAREITHLADGLAQLPLESVTRLQLIRLGFERPRLQVPVASPHEGTYWIDIALDDVDAFCEVDGKGKYVDEALRSGRSLEEVLLEEKQREDWIRGVTQRRFARVGDDHTRTPGALAARLASFGIRPRHA